jgi:hypothetical protein
MKGLYKLYRESCIVSIYRGERGERRESGYLLTTRRKPIRDLKVPPILSRR